MVAEAVMWVNVEDAVREWIRANVPLVGGRVFFGYNSTALQPQIVVRRIAGPDSDCLIQCDVWAADKPTAASAAAQLSTQAELLSRYVKGNVLLKGAAVDSMKWLPDDESDMPRYIVDITFTASYKP